MVQSPFIIDMTTRKRPKFKSNMVKIEAMQDSLIKALPLTVMNLKWRITNTSETLAWPHELSISNFSHDSLTEGGINSFLKEPIPITGVLLKPGESYVFECDFTVPFLQNGRKVCTLNLYLTNPQKNFEKLVDGLITVIEVLEAPILEDSKLEELENSEYELPEEEEPQLVIGQQEV